VTEATEISTTAQGHRKSEDFLYEINALKFMRACAGFDGKQECVRTKYVGSEL
jgi:hypothetical protein